MKKQLLVGMVGATLLLGACGNGSTGNNSAEKKDVTFGEIFNKGKKVSFEVENKPDNDDHKPVKDSYVNKYIFTNDGKQTIYNGSRETTLEEIKDKSNEEILKIAKKEDEEVFNKLKNNNIDIKKIDIKNDKNFIESEKKYPSKVKEMEKKLENNEKELEKIRKDEYESPNERPVKIKVKTDGSGNNTSNEWFFIQTNYDEDGNKNNNDKLKNTYTSYSVEHSPVEIFDDSYGWLSQNNDDPRKFLVTKVGDKVEQVKLDEPDSKYINEAK